MPEVREREKHREEMFELIMSENAHFSQTSNHDPGGSNNTKHYTFKIKNI